MVNDKLYDNTVAKHIEKHKLNSHTHHICPLTSLSLSLYFTVSSGRATEPSDAAAAAYASAADDDAAAHISIPAATAGSLHCPGETPHTPGALVAGPFVYFLNRRTGKF